MKRSGGKGNLVILFDDALEDDCFDFFDGLDDKIVVFGEEEDGTTSSFCVFLFGGELIENIE